MSAHVKAGFVEPMLLLKTEKLPEGSGWFYEIKSDGYRAIAFKTGGTVHLRSRNDNDFAPRYPSIVKALAKLPDETAIDSEVVALDKEGRPSFQILQNYGNSPGPVVFFIFDLLILAGRDVKKEPLSARRELLETKVLRKLKEPIRYAKERNIEQTAVFEDRRILTDALRRSMGHVPLERVKSEFAGRIQTGEFLERSQGADAIARAHTTPEMVVLEQQTITKMLVGQAQQSSLATLSTQLDVDSDQPVLNPGQRAAIAAILESRDTIVALDGVAGSGKTTALAAIRAAAEREGYAVQGLAPTSNAAKELQKAGMVTQTVQRYLVRLGKRGPSDAKQLHVLDESSLASTVQMHQFLTTLGPQDRVILVGDTRQHQSVEAGRIYEQLIEAGLTTARLDTIVRQQDAAYKAVVEQLANGNVREALADMDRRGFVVTIPKRSDRVRAVADDFCRQPDGALVVAPANDARRALNDAIHAELRTQRRLTGRDRETAILVERQETTGADRRWVHTYVEGDTLRFSTRTASLGIEAGDYATVTGVDGDTHRLTVQHEDGRTLTYDPNRLYGVNIYRQETRFFSVGDRVQFKQPFRDRDIANAKLGTILAVSGTGIRIKVDGREKSVAFTFDEYRHLDYGYAVTSYSSQGLTAHRVILDVDCDQPGGVSNRVAYTALSRGVEAAIIYTNDSEALPRVLDRDNSHRSAIELTGKLHRRKHLEIAHD